MKRQRLPLLLSFTLLNAVESFQGASGRKGYTKTIKRKCVFIQKSRPGEAAAFRNLSWRSRFNAERVFALCFLLNLLRATGSMESSLEFSNSLGSVSSLLTRCRTFKVLVIGDSGVGKTCLTHRLCAGEFPSRVEATIGVDFRERLLDIDGEKLKLQLWDTAGQERFRKSMVQHYYRNVHAVLFVYDVTFPASFSGLTAWIEECRQNSLGQGIPRFLVGNKSDLRDPRRTDGQVSQERAMSFAKAHGMMFFETSAKNPPNKCVTGRRGDGEVPYQQDKVEDIVVAVGDKLKRQKKPSAANPPAYSGSFKVLNKKRPEKDPWTCC